MTISPFFQRDGVTIHHGDCREVLGALPAAFVHTVVTSPPYWGLRDYSVKGQLGLEPDADCLGWVTGRACGACYVCRLTGVFREVHRVLRPDGTLWLNLGDTWNGYVANQRATSISAHNQHARPFYKKGYGLRCATLKNKDLIGIPWRVALALQAGGYFLRSEQIWAKPNPMPESVGDRPTKSHEQVFLLSKSERYFYDAEAIKEPVACGKGQRSTDHYNTNGRGPRDGGNRGLDKLARRLRSGEHSRRNKRSVWTVPTRSYKGAHFAVFPADLIRPCLLAGTSAEGCCAQCGAPYRRVVESERMAPRPSKTKANGRSSRKTGNRDPQRQVILTRTRGFEPGCDCRQDRPPVPCVVLDPFLGSGTTAVVAQELGCRTIGIELNEEYCRLAADRFRQRNLFAGDQP